MTIPFYDHTVLYRELKPELDAAVARALEGGRLDWGPELPAFEAEFARWLGVAHAVGTNSGTAALKVALLALGIGRGDEVITVPNSDIGSTAAIHHAGATAVWVDVEPDTGNIDPIQADAAVTPRTAAILPVDLYGHPADLPALRAVAGRHGLAIVEDACLALGAAIGDRRVGQWADVTCFSFAPSKHLGGYGSGGAAVTADAALARRMERFAGYGQDRARHYREGLAAPPLEHRCEGLNERLDELQAAMLRVKLPHLRGIVDGYVERAAAYSEALAGTPVRPPAVRPDNVHTFRNYVVHLEERDAVRRRLAHDGIATGLHYAPPLHRQPVYRETAAAKRPFPVADRLGTTLLSLPIGAHLGDDDCRQVAHALAAAAS
ncbi:MAG: DegT/DnrJ/EryC1/StrS family aminotransferase [Immundisolibacterales bacterium]|nr:DegT/DnrJ/EryC1/StrS family aminotransferase [Immundisolibacterales bacterium]